MKKALSITVVTALSLLVFLYTGFAQGEGAKAVSDLLEQQLSQMEAAFGGLETFMGQLVREVKGNMADIDTFTAKVGELRDMVTAVSVEIKSAEGKILRLRQDVDAMAAVQQEFKMRIQALEAGLSELSAFCDDLRDRLSVARGDLNALRTAFDAWVADYEAFKAEYRGFREAILADIEALKAGIYGDLNALRDSIYADMAALEQTLTSDITMLEAQQEQLTARVRALEEEDVGTFKKKVVDLERAMAALAIRVDNNRAKLEGFDYAFADLSEQMASMRGEVLKANEEFLSKYELRLQAVEDDTQLKSQIDTLYFISIVALLAGVGALIWGFLGNN